MQQAPTDNISNLRLNKLGKLEIPTKLSFPVINISTFELGRAEIVLEEVAKRVGKLFVKMPYKKLPIPDVLKASVEGPKKESDGKGAVVFNTFF